MDRSPLNIHQVIGRLRNFGGPAYTVPALCSALAGRDEVALHALKPLPDLRLSGVAVAAYEMSAGIDRAEPSRAMRLGLRRAALDGADILHSHGLWCLPAIYPAAAVRGTACRLVASPRGTLDPWTIRHHRWRKLAWWHARQRRALRAAHCLHATAAMEYDAFRAAGLANPVTIIPNGQDLPALPQAPAAAGPRRLLFLARIHPKKGIDLLLNAWARLEPRFPDWQLDLVGPDDADCLPGYRALAARLGLARCRFHGEVSRAERDRHFRAAQLYVLPTHGENWGASIAEALAHGLPAIVSRAAPWSGLETHGCGWWIDNEIGALTRALEQALSLPPEELRARGLRGREWIGREFSWERVGEMMRATYLWLARGAARPDWVQL